MDKKKIGQRIRLARIFSEQRTGHKMTQEILAKKVGAKRGTIGDIKLGRSACMKSIKKPHILGVFCIMRQIKKAPSIKTGYCSS